MSPVAVLLGAGRGMAFEAARELGRRGFSLAITDADPARAEQGARALTSDGFVCEWAGIDSRDKEALVAFAEVQASRGPLGTVVSAVGGSLGTPRWIEEIGPADVEAVIDLCAGSALNALEAFGPALIESAGSFVVVSSGAARVGDRVGWSPVYACGKGAALGVVRWIACDPAWQGVRAMAVCPGDVLTERTLEIFAEGGWTPEEQEIILHQRNSLGRIATAAELGYSIAALAADTFASGAILDVVGGEFPTPA